MKKYNVECVANVSEGRNTDVIGAIAESIKAVEGVQLLHVDSGHAANRTVFTFAGNLDTIFDAAFAMYKTAFEKIDMRNHKGTHPRIGAVDVCPFIALEGCDESDLIAKTDEFAKRISEELGIDVFLYEKNARSDQRQNLANIRNGEYEGLSNKIKSIDWKADYRGKNAEILQHFGATVVGVRNFLIAFNVNIDTDDVSIAQNIAEEIRELGKMIRLHDGSMTRLPGLLKSVKAIGWYVEEYKMAQVSFNLTDIDNNGVYEVYEATRAAAKRNNIECKGSELIGMIPLREMIRAGENFVKKRGESPGKYERDELIKIASEELGLSSVKTFDPNRQVLEYKIEE